MAIERAGVRIDGPALASQAQRIDEELYVRARRIYELSGEEFNINSPKKLGEILFDKMGLTTETLKRTSKTKAHSTAFEVLEELGQFHELPRLVLEWRGMMKLKGTYIDALPQLVNPETGRVHTCFNQAVAATGRLSSSDPNLQNIPIRTEIGREIRRAFVAEAGHVLISADYSQIELRVLAHLSGDPALLEAFTQNIDIHDRTALKVFGADSGLSAHELRRRAKIINYALLYGKQAFTLAKDIGVSREEAQAFIDAYFAGFPSVRAFIDGLLEEARQTGTVKTMFGRRRLVPDLNNRNGQVRAAAERAAVNMPIQGSAADILKKAMIDVHAALPSDRRRPRAHDPHRPRRAAVRGAAGSRGRNRRRGASADGVGGGAEGAGDGRRRHRRELERSEELISAIWRSAESRRSASYLIIRFPQLPRIAIVHDYQIFLKASHSAASVAAACRRSRAGAWRPRPE